MERRGDILVADMEELENMDTSDIYPRRINAKEVLSSHRCQYVFVFFFQQQLGTAKSSGKRPRIPNTHSKTGTTCTE